MAHATAAHARPRLHLPRTVAAPDDIDGTRAALADLIAQRDALVRQADADARERSRLVARVEHLQGLLNQTGEARGLEASATAQAYEQAGYWQERAERCERAVPQYAAAMAAKDTEIRQLRELLTRTQAALVAAGKDWKAENAARGIAETRARNVEAERDSLLEMFAEARDTNAQLTHDLVVAGKLPLLVNMGPN